MDRHLDVSCDACHAQEFKGRRFKCLVCYDFDLCGKCYDSGATADPHRSTHPVQCVLSRSDIALYFGGELPSSSNTHSYTCPICSQMGFTLISFIRHNVDNHTENSSTDVICPVCVVSGGEQNFHTRNLAYHLISRHPISEHQEIVPFEAIFSPETVDFQAMGRRAMYRVLSRMDSLAALDRAGRNPRQQSRRVEDRLHSKPEVKLSRVLSLTNSENVEKTNTEQDKYKATPPNQYLCDNLLLNEQETPQHTTNSNLKNHFIKDVLVSTIFNNNENK